MTERILLTGDHPWAGHTAEVVEEGLVLAGSNCKKARLDNGQEVIVFPGQSRAITGLRQGGEATNAD